MPDLLDQAHARRTDPRTSHEAAAAATLGIERQRAMVLAYAKSRGMNGFMDVQLEEAYPDESDSGLRTRRSELTARNIVLDSGRRDRHSPRSNRRRIIWIHREFVPNPPPEREAPPNAAQTDVLKGEAHSKAATLRTNASYLRKTYGLDALARDMESSADLLQQLAR
jgi:hypothetical protein